MSTNETQPSENNLNILSLQSRNSIAREIPIDDAPIMAAGIFLPLQILRLSMHMTMRGKIRNMHGYLAIQMREKF